MFSLPFFAKIVPFLVVLQLRLDHDNSDAAGASFFVEEDSCGDDEQTHVAELVGWIAVAPGSGPSSAAIQAYPVAGAASESTIGESGSVSTAEDGWTTIALKGSYIRPVLFAGVPTSNGGQEAVVRIQQQRLGCATLHCFQIRVVEPGCLDQWHV